MNDVFIFGMGLLVSLVVATAVGVLLWGAGHEASEREVTPRVTKRVSGKVRAAGSREAHSSGVTS